MTVDREGSTSLPGLWAAGEVTSSGLHGANRLASNSLLEALVYGTHAGRNASLRALADLDGYQAYPIENLAREEPAKFLDLVDIRNSLTSLMWRDVGVRRHADRMQQALTMIDRWQRYVLGRQFCARDGWELQNMLTVARLMVQSALTRQESRGVHLRMDFPDMDNANWLRHQALQRESDAAPAGSATR